MLRGIPLGTEGLDPTQLLQNVINDALDETTTIAGESQSHRLALALARRAAMPAGVELSAEELQHLLTSLAACKNSAYTPEGLPTYRRLALSDIEALF